MASTSGASAKKGMSVKNEHDDAEINAMALKMKENYQKTATGAAKQQAAPPANVNINRAVRAVTLANAPITTDNSQTNQNKLPKDCETVESIKGRFSWKLIEGHHVPYIFRVINGEQLKFVSVRMAETQLLKNYLRYLHADIYKCTYVKSLFITKSEAKLLNDINHFHANSAYGRQMYVAGKDYIVLLEDLLEFYAFIEICSKKLLCTITPGLDEKCGFIRINSDSVVPYCIKDNQKYVPLFYFEGETDNLRQRAVKVKNWNLSYLKFCCKVQGIRDELFASESCKVTTLDEIKNYFPPATNFEEYWPAKVVDTNLLINQRSNHVNPSGVWIRAPPAVVPTENTIAHTVTASAPLPPSMPAMMNTYQNGWPANQMVNSYSTHAQPPSTHGYSISARNQSIAAQSYNAVNSYSTHAQPPSTHGYSIAARNQSIAAQSYNAGSTMSQGSSLVYSGGNVVPSPHLVRADNMTPIISQTRQFYTQHSNNSHAQQQQLQQQQIITTPQTQQSNSGKSVHGRLTNTQQRNALKNAGPVANAPPIEFIDLLSPPSSPVPPAVQENSLRPNIAWEITRIPERVSEHDTANNAVYKIQQAPLEGRMITCINSKPYIYSDLMVTLSDLVQLLLPSCTVERCAYVINKYLETTLFTGNSEQLALLRETGSLRSTYPSTTPMAMLRDVVQIFPRLKALVLKQDEQIQQYHSGPAKRQRPS